MIRRVTTQDVSWFLDLYGNKQLDLDPTYQRRSVWSTKDRRFYLDTIFRGYPCPAIFLHKELDEHSGKQIYHVVDGKQRLETIISFVNNKIAVSKDFGDVRLAGKKWKNIEPELDLKKKLWDYVLSVEFLDTTEGTIINEVFERLNRNSRKLERQEIRHAKYDGWFIATAEKEAELEEWSTLGIVTKARAKRMQDVQFMSELLIVLLKNRIDGFDQDYLDLICADYDSLEEHADFSEDDFLNRLEVARKYVLAMEKHNNAITNFAKGVGHFYSLWSIISLNKKLPKPTSFATKYSDFMKIVEMVASETEPSESGTKKKEGLHSLARKYFRNSIQASTDQPQRQERFNILQKVLLK